MLLQASRDFAIDATTTSSTALTSSNVFLASQINNTIGYLFSEMSNHKTQPLPRTATTTADQIYYHIPPGMMNIETVTMTVGEVVYPLRPIHSQEFWDKLQEIDVQASTVPQYFFQRQYDFGIYPTPDDAYTITVVGNYIPKNLSASDYSEGTISISQNSASVTGSGTTFTSAMAGRWLVETNSDGIPTGNWYKISSYTSATAITLETVFEESSLSGATYLIGESPEIPEEMHEYIPYRSAAAYYATVRKDSAHAQTLLNYFYTGDFNNSDRRGKISGGILGIISRYKNVGRANSQISNTNRSPYDALSPFDPWAITLSAES